MERAHFTTRFALLGAASTTSTDGPALLAPWVGLDVLHLPFLRKPTGTTRLRVTSIQKNLNNPICLFFRCQLQAISRSQIFRTASKHSKMPTKWCQGLKRSTTEACNDLDPVAGIVPARPDSFSGLERGRSFCLLCVYFSGRFFRSKYHNRHLLRDLTSTKKGQG